MQWTWAEFENTPADVLEILIEQLEAESVERRALNDAR